jgi:hypothetical protein
MKALNEFINEGKEYSTIKMKTFTFDDFKRNSSWSVKKLEKLQDTLEDKYHKVEALYNKEQESLGRLDKLSELDHQMIDLRAYRKVVSEALTYKKKTQVNEDLNESVLITTSILLILSGIWMGTDSPYEDEGLSGWWKKKVVPKLQSIMGSDKKVSEIINKIKNNPDAIEAITKASDNDKENTIKKYIDEKEFKYLSDVTKKITKK